MRTRDRTNRSREAYAQTDLGVARSALGLKATDLASARARVTELEAEIAALEAKAPPMREGAVVMMDALGFKGIWKRHPGGAEAVLSKMTRIRETLNTYGVPDDPKEPILTGIRCECISDTIVIGVRFREESVPEGVTPFEESYKAGLVMLAAANATSTVCEIGLTEEPRFAYRGSIAYGEFEMRDGFIVGPAVDDAAEQMEQAEGALVWCTPSALKRLTRFAPNVYNALCPFTVPLKGGRSFDSQCVIPYSALADTESPTDFVDLLLETFEATPGFDIAVKKQNTVKFLAAAKAQVMARKPPPIPEGPK